MNWTDDKTVLLTDLWSEDSVQAQLEGCRRNKAVYEKLVEKMSEAEYERDAERCRSKVKKLKQEYRKIKDSNAKSGEDRKTWRFYDAMDDILGAKPTTRPQVVLDTYLGRRG